jgi:hypothetical protein
MIHLLNTSILTGGEGNYRLSSIDLATAKGAVKDGHVSHIGHESTAQLLTALLGVEVAFDRTPFMQTPVDTALVFKLKGRAPEGVILTVEEIEAIGYEFFLLNMSSEDINLVWDLPQGWGYGRSWNGGSQNV